MSFCEPARVVTVTSLTPHMRRISIEAEGDWHWPTGGQGDERIDIAFPKPGETEADYDYFNNPDYGKADLGTEPPWRHYTVRKVHDGGRRLDIDFVVHPGGIAADWALRAEPGHLLGVFWSDSSRSHYQAPAVLAGSCWSQTPRVSPDWAGLSKNFERAMSHRRSSRSKPKRIDRNLSLAATSRTRGSWGVASERRRARCSKLWRRSSFPNPNRPTSTRGWRAKAQPAVVFVSI